MQWFKNNGWVVDNASPGIEVGNVDNQYDVDIQRSPFSLKNISALFQLKSIISSNHYDIIHCHTPMGAVLGRLAAMLAHTRRKGTKIIYTVHGFHFFKGASLINWIIYCPIELILSCYTNAIVTINNEDYHFALKHKMAHGKIYRIDGVGCNLNKFGPLSIQEILSKSRAFRFVNEYMYIYRKQVTGAISSSFSEKKYRDLYNIFITETAKIKDNYSDYELKNALLSFMAYEFCILLG